MKNIEIKTLSELVVFRYHSHIFRISMLQCDKTYQLRLKIFIHFRALEAEGFQEHIIITYQEFGRRTTFRVPTILV